MNTYFTNTDFQLMLSEDQVYFNSSMYQSKHPSIQQQIDNHARAHMSNVNIKSPVHPHATVRTMDPFDSPENLFDSIFHWHFSILQNYVQK